MVLNVSFLKFARALRLRQCVAVWGGLLATVFATGAGQLAWAQLPDIAPQSSASGSGLPNLGDSSEMSPGAERQLGDRIARALYRDPDYVDDPIIQEYVNNIWQSLIAAARARGELPDALYNAFAWEILTGRDRTVNAFALPGGYFGLHLGLVGIVTTQDELASVLAHELSHVTQRHISRSMSRQNDQAPWVMGAMILGLLAASKNVAGGEAVMIGGQAAAAQTQLNYSRSMEREADRIGFNVSTQAGFSGIGFVSMFEKLQQSGRLNDSGGFPYLRTHPLTTERMADMQARVHQLPADPLANQPAPEHAMVAARARLLSASDVDSLRLWLQQAEPAHLRQQLPIAQLGILYGATLAALRLHDHTQATEFLRQLQLRPLTGRAQRLVQLLDIELALAEGAVARAVVRSQGQDLQQRASLFAWAQSNMRDGQPDHARAVEEQLRVWLADHVRDAAAWQLLAQVHQTMGQPIAAVRDAAEVDVAHCDYSAALARLQAALDLVGKSGATADPFDAAIVETRSRQIGALLKEQMQERP